MDYSAFSNLSSASATWSACALTTNEPYIHNSTCIYEKSKDKLCYDESTFFFEEGGVTNLNHARPWKTYVLKRTIYQHVLIHARCSDRFTNGCTHHRNFKKKASFNCLPIMKKTDGLRVWGTVSWRLCWTTCTFWFRRSLTYSEKRELRTFHCC